MSTIIIGVNITGAADEADRRAMLHIIGLENAALPSGILFPSGTNNERRTSYETILAARLTGAHLSNVRESDFVSKKELVEAFERADEVKRAAMLAAGQ